MAAPARAGKFLGELWKPPPHLRKKELDERGDVCRLAQKGTNLVKKSGTRTHSTTVLYYNPHSTGTRARVHRSQARALAQMTRARAEKCGRMRTQARFPLPRTNTRTRTREGYETMCQRLR